MNNLDMIYPILQNIKNHTIKQKILQKLNIPRKDYIKSLGSFSARKKRKTLIALIKNTYIFKYENVGHFKNKCSEKQKINELNINAGLSKQLLLSPNKILTS